MALATSVVGAMVAVLVGALGRGVLGATGFFFDAEGVLPISMIGTLLGTLGAMIGRGTRHTHEPRATAV